MSAADRAAFKRCRRQWDFTASVRRGRSPLRRTTFDLDRAVRDALAVYYFPGMWDWDAAIVLPLVNKALDNSLARQCEAIGGDPPDRQSALDRAHRLLERYFAWAPAVDRFSPIRVETDFDAIVPDPANPEHGLVGPGGGGIHYTGRIDLLAIDEYDRYWVVRHRVLDEPFPSTEQLVLDEDSLAACWAWGRFYDGMEIAGTIYNELSPYDKNPSRIPGRTPERRGGIPQHEPSGGGRGVSSPRRAYVKGRPAESADRISQIEGNGLRRTTIRRSTAEIHTAGVQLADELLDMFRPGVRVYPNPAPAHCSNCAFVAPCLAVHEGRDVEPLLEADYRKRPAFEIERGRLGGTPFGVGRGWVPGSHREG
ncbi:hypothetical protein F3087_13630 [Nocardia colli]|uniref:PD-(D/E)XK endonuclease-like domain-containing protein n=1 Tax=Nocardia colli TaxID=2545717 RepID=A0A5N0EHM6_9NOCA|nr:hypothetical protein [Nocardia colli]KAA8888109.1 hypothetical protein F3087_13630 [Nocardia colli]